MISLESGDGSSCLQSPPKRPVQPVGMGGSLPARFCGVAGVLLTLLLGACGQSNEGAFLLLANDQTPEDSSEEEEEALPDDEQDEEDDQEDDKDSDENPDWDWVPGPVVDGEVVFLGDGDSFSVVGASVSEFGVDGAAVQTNENGRFSIEVENQDPWRLYISASEDMTPSIWTTSEDAVDAGGMPVLVNLLGRAYCEDVWAVDFRTDRTEDVGAIVILIWKDGYTDTDPGLAGLSVAVDSPQASLWGLNAFDVLVPVDGLLPSASEGELWLVDVPVGVHNFSWTSPPGYECFAPEQVPVMGRTNTWLQMGCREL